LKRAIRGRITMLGMRRRHKLRGKRRRQIEAEVVHLVEAGQSDAAVKALAREGLLAESTFLADVMKHGSRGRMAITKGRAAASASPRVAASWTWIQPAARALAVRGQALAAARLCHAANHDAPALGYFSAWAKDAAREDVQAAVTQSERHFIAERVAAGMWHPDLARLVAACGGIDVMTIRRLVRDSRLEQAAAIYRWSPEAAAALMVGGPAAARDQIELAQMFELAGDYQRAGILFERGGAFGRAASAFDRAGEPERAASCRERMQSASGKGRLRRLFALKGETK
jgi:hypothetical protein